MPATTHVPDAAGRFGPFGGRYVPETLTRALEELTAQYERAAGDPAFQAELGRAVSALRRPAVAAVPRPAAQPSSAAGRRST